VTWTDGRSVSEKELGRLLKVQFTPSLLVLDEQARVIARLNGYFPPHRMQAALDWIERRLDAKLSLAEHLQASAPEAASPTLHPNPAFLSEPHDLAARLRRRGAKPLLVLFERPSCLGCDELHRDGLGRPEVAALLKRFDVVRLDSSARTPLVTPAGARTDGRAWARELALPYAPALVFFDATRREVFRVEAYVRAFHLASALDYVASGAHRTQPSFQRFVQARAERQRGGGPAIDLWK
jgi:thioredoxin-related protein